MLLDLGSAEKVQGDLWTIPDGPRSKSLMKALDSLNAHYERGTLAYASSGRRQAWKLRQDHISPQYTTCRDELLVVRVNDWRLEMRRGLHNCYRIIGLAHLVC
jgi:DNA polymerase V